MLMEGLDTDFDGVISMHLWSHLWWDKRRRDFSRVHAGMLTEDYLRTVDTTYSIAARRFLPAPGHRMISTATAEHRPMSSVAGSNAVRWSRAAHSWLRGRRITSDT